MNAADSELIVDVERGFVALGDHKSFVAKPVATAIKALVEQGSKVLPAGLLGYEAAARYCQELGFAGVTDRSLRRAVRNGCLRYGGSGSHIEFRTVWLEQWLQKRTRN